MENMATLNDNLAPHTRRYYTSNFYRLFLLVLIVYPVFSLLLCWNTRFRFDTSVSSFLIDRLSFVYSCLFFSLFAWFCFILLKESVSCKFSFCWYVLGTVLDAALLWQNSLNKHFDGTELCPICYALFHASNYSLPTMPCKTCKTKFHSACLVLFTYS